jgi:hypothetical protein
VCGEATPVVCGRGEGCDGSHDGAPTKNVRKRTKPPKAMVLTLHLAKRNAVRVAGCLGGRFGVFSSQEAGGAGQF